MSFRTATFAAALMLVPIATHAQSNEPTSANGPTLEQRVQRIEDEAAIRNIILKYAVAIDSRDFEGYVSLFAKEGIWQTGSLIKKGPDEIRAMLVGIYGEVDPAYVNMESFRIVSNIEVNVQGDRASASSRHLSIQRDENGTPTPYLTGIYEDEYIREDGEWKILHRVDYPIMPTPEEWGKQMAERRAAREKAAE